MRPLLAGSLLIACCERIASGAYILNGQRSAVGAYALPSTARRGGTRRSRRGCSSPALRCRPNGPLLST